MDREAWRAAIHGVAKSRTRLSDWTELNWTEERQEWRGNGDNFSQHFWKVFFWKGAEKYSRSWREESREHVYVNEINTIPGSFSFYLWEHNDLPFTKLIDVLIEEALRQAQLRKDKVLKYDSKILDNLTRNGKQGGCKR